jgi:GTP-binding protein
MAGEDARQTGRESLLDDHALEAGRLLFAGPVMFERGVVNLDSLPPADRAEVCFAGRSNVGKSSLINALTGRNTLARASAEPGRTRELNFFLLGEKARLVDLPGYGYAKAPKADIARWTKLTRDYLRGRPGLSRAFLLIDSRHGLKDTDLAVMKLFKECALVYQIVLTKADKIKPTELEAMRATTLARLKKEPAAHPVVLSASSVTQDGIAILRGEIAQLCGGA